VFAVQRGGRDLPRDHRVFREGKRTKRTRARIKFLVDEWGVERLRSEVERRVGRSLPLSVEPAEPVDPHRDHLGVHPQLEPGLYYLGGSTLRGRFTAEQMIGAADIADRFGSGALRCTNRQNIVVLDVLTGTSRRWPPNSATSACQPRPRRSGAASSPAPA
jgi:sulfite reductase beta subunit-like hemoprotein